MEKEQFDHFVENTQYALVATLSKITLSWESARDIAQDAFLKIWEIRQTLSAEKKPESLLFKIAINKAIDLKRSRGYKLHSLEKSGAEKLFSSDTTSEYSSELLQTILKFATGFKPKQQSCFILRDIEGFSFAEIAAILDINEQSVRTNLHHARKKIREFITQNFPEYIEELS